MNSTYAFAEADHAAAGGAQPVRGRGTARGVLHAVARVPQAALLLPLAPVVLVQGKRTARRTPRLDPASGAEYGVVGTGADHQAHHQADHQADYDVVVGGGSAFRLMVIGESTAVGVGAARHAEALPGYLAEALGERLQRSVAWSVTGKNGATARKVTRELVPSLNGAKPDLIVVTVGINDLIRRRSLKQWTIDLSELIGTLRDRYVDAEVVVAGMPPVRRFPAIPQPLRLVLGVRARHMDRIMREVARVNGATHAPMDEAMAGDRRLFAADGIHPSAAGYQVWAGDLARAVALVPART